MAKMKNMYEKDIFYDGHDRFLKLLYFIEIEKNHVDLTERRHNFYIQGKIARHRKFDKKRVEEIQDEKILRVDVGEGFITQIKPK